MASTPRPTLHPQASPPESPITASVTSAPAGVENRTREAVRPSQPMPIEDEPEPVVPRAPLHVTRVDDRTPEHAADHDAPRDRVRQRRGIDSGYGTLDLPVHEIPEGSSYEWKRYSNVGLEDPFYLSSMRQQGWEPVDPKRHPNWVPPGYNQPHIIKGGQILMERPIALTNEARDEMRQLAKRQVREAEQRLGMTPKDTLTREHPDVKPRLTKEIGRMVPQAIED